jgi:hypothetical protein
MHSRQVFPVLFATLAGLSLPAYATDPVPPESVIQEPKEAEIQRLYRERIDWINQGSVKVLGEEGAQKVLIKFDALKKTGCESPERTVFNCAVLVDSAVGAARQETRRLTLTLSKDGDDWRLQ